MSKEITISKGIAVVNNAIQAHKGKQLFEFKGHDFVRAKINNWAYLMGIKYEMDEAQKDIISVFIKNHFGNLTAEDITLAFEMASAGKLRIKDAETYQNFSIPYIGKILSAYRQHLHEERTYQIKRKPKERDMTDEEVQQAQKEEYEKIVDYIKANNELPSPMFANYLPAFFHAWRSGLLPSDKDELEIFSDMVKADLEEQIRQAKARFNKPLVKKLEGTLKRPYDFKTQCRKELLKKHLQTLIK